MRIKVVLDGDDVFKSEIQVSTQNLFDYCSTMEYYNSVYYNNVDVIFIVVKICNTLQGNDANGNRIYG